MWSRKADVEAGGGRLYPTMQESPELRWAFIRKVYVILSIQLLLTAAVAAVVVTVHPISHFITTTHAGLAVFILLIIIPFIGTYLHNSCNTLILQPKKKTRFLMHLRTLICVSKYQKAMTQIKAS